MPLLLVEMLCGYYVVLKNGKRLGMLLYSCSYVMLEL